MLWMLEVDSLQIIQNGIIRREFSMFGEGETAEPLQENYKSIRFLPLLPYGCARSLEALTAVFGTQGGQNSLCVCVCVC